MRRSPQRYLIYAVLWSFSGDGRLKIRGELGEYIRRITTVPLPSAPNVPIIDYEVHTPFTKWLHLFVYLLANGNNDQLDMIGRP